MHILRIVLLVVALAASAFLSWRFFDGALYHGTPAQALRDTPEASERARARADIEAVVARAPEIDAYLAALREAAPVDYARMIDGFAIRAARDGRSATPDLYLADAMRAVRQSRGLLASKSSAPALQRVFDAQADVLAAMAGEDAQVCAEFLHGGAAPGFPDFASAHRRQMAALARASLDAMTDGQRTMEKREPPADADFAALEQALRDRGLRAAEIDFLLDAKAADPPLPDPVLCKAGMLYLDALKGLPDETRTRIQALAIEVQARM